MKPARRTFCKGVFHVGLVGFMGHMAFKSVGLHSLAAGKSDIAPARHTASGVAFFDNVRRTKAPAVTTLASAKRTEISFADFQGGFGA